MCLLLVSVEMLFGYNNEGLYFVFIPAKDA